MLTACLLLLAASSISAPPTVELLDAGEAPRREVRYRLPEGVFVAQLDWQLSAAIVRGPLQGDEMHEPLLSAVLEVESRRRGEGATTLEVEVRAARVLGHDEGYPEHEEAALAQALSNTWGMRWRGEVDALGRVRWAPPPAGLDVTTNRLLEEMGRALASQLLVPVPEEPIGRGARWRVRAPARVGFVPHLVEEKACTLVSLADGAVEVSWELSLRASGAAIEVGVASVHIVEVRARGAGRGERRLDGVFPALADQSLEAHVTLQPDDVADHPGPDPGAAPGRGAFLAVFRTREVLRDLGPVWPGPFRAADPPPDRR